MRRPSTVCRVRHDGKWVECLVRLGVEVEIISNGTPLCSRILASSVGVLAWAD